jgi:MFS family permease
MNSWNVVYSLCLLVGLCALLSTTAMVVVVDKTYNSSTQTVQSVAQTCIQLLTIFAAPAFGKLSDKIGRNLPLAITAGLMPVTLVVLSFYEQLPILILITLNVICVGIGQSYICVIQAYIIDNSLPDDKLKNLGIMYATIAFSFLLGAGVGGVIESKFPVRGITFESWNVEEEAFTNNETLRAHTMLLRYIGLCLIVFAVVVSSLLPKGTMQKTEIEKMKDKEDRSFNFFSSITYIATARSEIKLMAVLNALRVGAFTPSTVSFVTYMIRRFGEISPLFHVFLGVSSIMGIISSLSIKRLSRNIGSKNMIVLGFVFLALQNIGYGIIQKSFYVAFFIPASFTFFGIVTNTMLDGVASSLVSSEEQGVLMGAMSQFRSFASFLLTIPCGLLFSYAAELDMAYRKSHNVDDVYFRGFPFLVFSIFGIFGACVVWFSFNSIDMNIKSPHKENEAGYYTKLDDGNDVEIADYEDETLDMAILVGSRSSSFVEMT